MMEEKTPYVDALRGALAAKVPEFERTELKKLRDAFKLFQSAFQALYNIILKKGLIQEDPYKYELKISEVTTPPESPFAENEKNDQMSLRLSQFESYLDFLNNYYQFSADFLTLGRIKRLAALTKYFNFVQFTETSNHTNTKYFAEIVQQVRKGTDQFSSGLLNETLLQLEKATKEILQILKDLAFLHRERWKLELRESALAGMSLEREWAVTHHEDAVKQIKQRFAEGHADKPFFPELAEEVLAEDYGSEAQGLRDAVLAKLAVKGASKKAEEEAKNFRHLLLDGIRTIVATGYQLADAVQKLLDNQTLLDNLDKSFFAKVRKALREMTGRPPAKVVHETEYLDPSTGERRLESVDFLAFTAEAQKRAQGFTAMIPRGSPTYKRLENATEDQAYKFLEKGIEDIQRYYRTIMALDDYFHLTITSPEDKPKVRSAKVELTAIKNTIIKANQKRYEYIAAKDEADQMKRLGIRSDS